MTIKKPLKHLLLYPILALLGFIVVYMSCAYCPARIAVDEEPDSTEDVAIYIKTNGVHTDIVVPVANTQMDWRKQVKFANTASADTTSQYLAIGWGDKGFYLETETWADLKASVAFKAGFGLGTTAIHATFYRNMTVGESCRKIMLSRAQYARLLSYLSESFQKDGNGHFLAIKTSANYGQTDAFYEAVGSYSMFRTCNTWADNSLKSCGQKARLWTPFDTGIFLKYDTLSHK